MPLFSANVLESFEHLPSRTERRLGRNLLPLLRRSLSLCRRTDPGRIRFHWKKDRLSSGTAWNPRQRAGLQV
jgi:hypothetical protein